MDLITDLPLANGFDSLLVVVDQGLSKKVILVPATKQSRTRERLTYFSKISTKDLDYLIKSSQIETLDLHQRHSKNY
jgi:hypothetical protein